MRKTSFKIAAIALAMTPATALTAPAFAGELSSSSSSGSINFTVVIPPLGAAIRAADTGAVGLWTITDATDGLMIKIDERGEQPVLTLFHGGGTQLDVRMSSDSGNARLLRSASDGGLESDHYGLAGLNVGVNVVTLSVI